MGTQPIIGTQINFKTQGIINKLPLFAKTKGYKNLTKLSSISYLESESISDPHCSLETLKDNSKDLIILSGSTNDLFGELFKLNKLNHLKNYLRS